MKFEKGCNVTTITMNKEEFISLYYELLSNDKIISLNSLLQDLNIQYQSIEQNNRNNNTQNNKFINGWIHFKDAKEC
jgi:hypothetical protein